MEDLDIDNRPEAPDRMNAGCTECGRDWYGPRADTCQDCRSAGGPPVACFQCGEMTRWVPSHEAECTGCDATYPLAKVRTFRLGQLVERLVKESHTGSAAEVGRMLLGAAGRVGLRRVQ